MDFCPDCCRVYQEHHEFCSSDATVLLPITREHDPLVGRVFDDRYELIRMIGAGGNGVVYLAKQVGLGRVVAFKMMYAERIREDRALKRFAREARMLAALDHPGCVRVLDYRAAEDSVPYLVMELVEGFELTALIQKGGIAPQHAVLIASQIAAAVDAAHRAGMVHRDLKPENVILNVKGAELGLRLIDFGLAIVLDDDPETRLTRQGRIVGTPEYMSPEQIMGRDTDGRTDIYALGVMLFELLTGVPPFRGVTQSVTLEMHLEESLPPLPLRDLPEPVAEKLRHAVFGMLQKKPQDRPRDAQEVADQMRALHSELPYAGRAIGMLELPLSDETKPSEDVTDTDVHELAPELRDPFQRRQTQSGDGRRDAPSGLARRTWLALAVGSLASIGLGVLLVFVFYDPPVDPPSSELVPGPSAPEIPTVPPDEEPDPNEGRMVVEDVSDGRSATLPTAGTIELPGGDLQSDYETALRSLGTRLSSLGLRPRDIRSHPRGMRAWTMQSRAASTSNYAEASAQIGEFSSVAASKSPREWMVYRLQRVESALGNSGSTASDARVHALWGTLERSSASPATVRRWLRRVDAIDSRSR